jgi:alpha-D-ribose 1-methylphosphonate 5-triphosphate synthase subunit PhnH
MSVSTLVAGFEDAAIDSQAAFRACMNALARPASIHAFHTALRPPAPLTAELAALALTLADHEAPLWLDEALRAEPAVRSYLAFHTGAHFVDQPSDAAFALISNAAACPALAAFAQGTDEYPDRSTTLLVAVDRLTSERDLVFTGPGIKDEAGLSVAPLLRDFQEQSAANRCLFPRGIDLVFVSAGYIAALPRSSQITGEA